MILIAKETDFDFLIKVDKHISEERLRKKIEDREILLVIEEGEVLGWLRFSYFWDEYPFMNMLFVIDGYRGQGLGKKLVSHWEERMYKEGHKFVMTSTQSNEQAQHFYRKLNYCDIGGFIMPNEPLEIMLFKTLNK